MITILKQKEVDVQFEELWVEIIEEVVKNKNKNWWRRGTTQINNEITI